MEQEQVQKSEEEGGKRCKKCGSKFIYIRIKEGSVVCRSCGFVDEDGV